MTGKEQCDFLKRMREKIAKENGISGFEYQKCPYDGPCTGTCPACDAETEALYEKLRDLGNELQAHEIKAMSQPIDLTPPQLMGVPSNFNEPQHVRLLGEIKAPDWREPGRTINHKLQKDEINEYITKGMILPEPKIPLFDDIMSGKIKQPPKMRGKVIEPKNKKTKQSNLTRKIRGLLGKKKDSDD